MKKTINIILVILIVASVALLAADNNHAAAYMRMGTDAKAMGMGGAVTASINNINAAYWNPANLNFLQTPELGTTYNDLGLDRKLNYFALGQHLSFGTLALSWMNSSVDGIVGYDENDLPTGNFGVGDNNISLSYANAWYGVNAGLNLKFYISDIEGEDTESGFGVDLGFNYPLAAYDLKLGLMLRDLYSSEIAGEAPPMQYNLGIAWLPYDYLTTAIDLRGEQNGDFEYALGAEYWNWIMPDYDKTDFFNETQGGLRLGLDNGNFTAGFGIKVRWIEFNYAYINEEFDNVFGDTHQFSLVFRPWDQVSRPEPEKVIVYETIMDTTYLETVITEEEVTIVRLSGTLMDEFGEPVSLQIAWKQTGEPEYSEFILTDVDGYFEVYLEKNTSYDYLISADDYFVEKGSVSVGEEDIDYFDIMLSKLDFSRYIINFDYNSAVIKEASYPILDNVASVLLSYPGTKVEIAGHCDNRGEDNYNKNLALDRAEAVRDYIVKKGVHSDQIHAVGYGYDYPLYSNDTEEGRAGNRRIELKILESGSISEGVLGCVGFTSGSTKINEYSAACLDMLAEQLRDNDNIKIEIAAFTDNVGSAANNLTLSQERAQSVVDYLITKGVKATKLTARGYGETQPVATNDNAAGREKNRRIEVRILEVESMKTGVLENIFFETGKAALSRESYPALNALAARMMANPQMKIELCGYTDNVGTEADNLELSQNRAEAVVDYLISAGISEERLIATGYGSASPIADNATFEGRARNRRIEVKILAQ
ncbi:MAG: OmpA family protein [Candidatus Cloacimonetes bacterium]|nr:OmpA family protein [Candidatus Cloacimonadota bacterium]